MHETQYVKALAASIEDAEALFREQVERLGGPDNWWRLMGAWDERSGEVRVPPPEPVSEALLEEMTPEEREEDARQAALEQEEDLRVLRDEYASREPWVRAAWECAASAYGVAGLPWMTFGEPSDDDLAAFVRFRAIPLDAMPAHFLTAAREALAAPDPPPHQIGLAELCQHLADAIADPGQARHLPFLREQGPNSWPAHLVGDGDADHAIYLMIDMHR